MGQVLIRRRVKAPSEQLSGVLYTPRMGSSATFTLKPLGEDFRFCNPTQADEQRRPTNRNTGMLTNIVDISGILVQNLQMCFRNGGTKSLRMRFRIKGREGRQRWANEGRTYVQEPVIQLSKASTSVHNFGHIFCDCFLADRVFENNNVTCTM